MKKLIFPVLMLLFILAVVLLLMAPLPANAESKDLNLFFGSTTSISGNYVWAVAIARVVNKHVPGIKITVVEIRKKGCIMIYCVNIQNRNCHCAMIALNSFFYFRN